MPDTTYSADRPHPNLTIKLYPLTCGYGVSQPKSCSNMSVPPTRYYLGSTGNSVAQVVPRPIYILASPRA